MKTMPRPCAQFEAIATIARRLNFRAKSVHSLSAERRAKQLAQMADVSDAVASRALVAYHFAAERPLMAAFLDALGIAHDQGLIKEDEVAPPDAAKTASAVKTVREAFPADCREPLPQDPGVHRPRDLGRARQPDDRVINWVERPASRLGRSEDRPLHRFGTSKLL